MMTDNNTMKTFRAVLVVLCMLLASPAISGMTALSDGQLAAFHAGSGISQDIAGTAKITIGSIYFQDNYTTKNRIELNNIVWDDGSGGAFSFSTPAGDPNTIDIGSNAAGVTYVNIHDATQVQPRTFSANLHFDEYHLNATDTENYDPGYYDPVRNIYDHMTDYIVHDLGTLEVSNIVRTENNLMIGAHGGVSFEYREKTDIDFAKYTYGANSSDALTFDGIHMSDTATWDPDTTPDNWTYSGPFQIGDMTSATPNPAKIDIGTDSSGTTVMQYQLPMTGTIIIEDVVFGTDAGNPKHFGPMVLDNLNVHSLALSINPNP